MQAFGKHSIKGYKEISVWRVVYPGSCLFYMHLHKNCFAILFYKAGNVCISAKHNQHWRLVYWNSSTKKFVCVCVPIYLYISQHEWILKSCLANKNVHLIIWKVDVTHTYVNRNEEEPTGFAVKEWCDRKTT